MIPNRLLGSRWMGVAIRHPLPGTAYQRKVTQFRCFRCGSGGAHIYREVSLVRGDPPPVVLFNSGAICPHCLPDMLSQYESTISSIDRSHKGGL
jgi:hypothetical protein